MSVPGGRHALLGAAAVGKNLFQIITDLGLTMNLKTVFDFGALGCYAGTGQTLTDLNAIQDHWLGSDTAADTTDPTFNGTAGALSASEYFSYDGGDWMRAKAQPTYASELHKDLAKLTIMARVRMTGSTGDFLSVLGTDAASNANVGISFYASDGANGIQWRVSKGGAPYGLAKGSTSGLTLSTNHWVGISIDEGGGAVSFFWLDGAYSASGGSDQWDATVTSPSAAAATATIELGALGNGVLAAANTTRIHAVAIWQGTALTLTQMNSIRTEMLTRFP